MVLSEAGSRVSELMPCRNVEMSFFREALGPVVAQTSPRWNLSIVVDVDDPDTTSAIMPEIERGGVPRSRVVENEDTGLAGALNTGIRHARTPYVCILYADDRLDREAIQVLDRYIEEHPDVDYFHSSRISIDDEGVEISDVRRSVDTFTMEDFKVVGPVKSLHCFRVKSALEVGGMDESLDSYAVDDYDFSWSMAEAGYTFKAIPECLYYYRDHRSPFRLTTHIPLEAQVRNLVKIWQKHGMTEREIEEQIHRGTADYLRQALFLNESDRRQKEHAGYDIRRGWRETYSGPGLGSGAHVRPDGRTDEPFNP